MFQSPPSRGRRRAIAHCVAESLSLYQFYEQTHPVSRLRYSFQSVHPPLHDPNQTKPNQTKHLSRCFTWTSKGLAATEGFGHYNSITVSCVGRHLLELNSPPRAGLDLNCFDSRAFFSRSHHRPVDIDSADYAFIILLNYPTTTWPEGHRLEASIERSS